MPEQTSAAKFKAAKYLQEGDQIKTAGGTYAEVETVQVLTNRSTVPHMKMIEITYLSGENGDLLFGALLTRNQKVEVL